MPANSAPCIECPRPVYKHHLAVSCDLCDQWQHIKCVNIAIYFSAHWCPPCRGFTPVLAEFYDAHKDDFVVIFASSDRDQSSFDEYFGEMPWYAVPFSKRDIKESLSGKYGVRGIPTLVVLKPDGSVIEANGRGSVASSNGKFPETWC